MKPVKSRQVIPLLVAFVVAAGNLLVPESALADLALFRVERTFRGAPFPAATPGGAGLYEVYVEPYAPPFTTRGGSGTFGGAFYPYGVALVESGNPIGSPFTLQSKFIDFQGTYTGTAMTGFPGYTTISGFDYYNFPGRFGPSNGATKATRLVFPTTGGNKAPNRGAGNPVTPTTTFDGRYDFSRAGSINVTPGVNRFGGTMQFFHRPTAFFYQYIYKFSPAIYKAYGSFRCQDPPKVDCTVNGVTTIGEITSSGMVTRFLLNVKGTGTGTAPPYTATNKAKATTPTTPDGTFPTPLGNASFIAAKNYYLHLLHPWTTGFISVYNYLETPFRITPQKEGYDVQLGGVDLTITHVYTSNMFNPTLSTVTYTESTYKQFLKGVSRVVSMVRPRLVHVYQKPLDLDTDPIITNFQAARLWTMRVFFLPEPTGVVMLGAGIALLLGLSRVRRR